MKVQVLVAAMNQNDYSLPGKMNICSEAIIANQCDRNSIEKYTANGHAVQYLNFAERGVGLNRNNALMRASGEICLFADDDMVYVEGYAGIVKSAFDKLPKADAIIFNITTMGKDMGRRPIKRIRRLRFYNALNYGAARIAVRTASIRRENITFHTCFGGGTIYSCGEDTLFIVDMLKHGLKIYTYPACIAAVDQTSSTWFAGYNRKYLHDKGALFSAISKRWAKLLCLQDLLRHPYIFREQQLTLLGGYKMMKLGIKDFRTLDIYK